MRIAEYMRCVGAMVLPGIGLLVSSCLCECKSSRPFDYYYALFRIPESDRKADPAYYLQLKGYDTKYPLLNPDLTFGLKLPLNLNHARSVFFLHRGSRTDSIQIGYTRHYVYEKNCGMELLIFNPTLEHTSLPTGSVELTGENGRCYVSVY